MNCCFIIILLLLLGHGNSSCGSNCIEPRRRAKNTRDTGCDHDCTRTQTVITRTECDMNSCPVNMTSDTFVNNRYSMYNTDNNDCGCRN